MKRHACFARVVPALVLTTLIALGLPAKSFSQPVQRGPAVSRPHSANAVSLSDQIEDIVTGPQFANVYGGDQVSQSTGAVTVYVTSAGRGAIAAALSGLPSGAYQLVTVARSFASLSALTHRIATDSAGYTAAGVKLIMWGPDPSTNTVQVHVEGDSTKAAANYFSQTYGDAVSVVADPSASSTRPGPGSASPSTATDGPSRYYDHPDFWNGDRIWMDNTTEGCTANFTFQDSAGNRYSMTAGHCTGSTIWTNDEDENQGSGSSQGAYQMGSVVTRSFTNGGWDALDFTCPDCDGEYVWSEGESILLNPGVPRQVVGTCTCGKGQKVAFDGATSGEKTGNPVEYVNWCANFPNDPNPKTCNLNGALIGAETSQDGDSGGPVYQVTNSTSSPQQVKAAGLIVGDTIVEDDTIGWYHTIAGLEGLFGLTLTTS